MINFQPMTASLKNTFSVLIITIFLMVPVIHFVACKSNVDTAILTEDSNRVSMIYDTSALLVLPDTVAVYPTLTDSIDPTNLDRERLVAYAKTLLGVPYKYASTDPAQGFDCSGFITYVFNHFNTQVPRSSVQFTNVGKEVATPFARPGDLILFTGTDSTEKFVGHMGIVASNTDTLKFIHASSGKAMGVTISPLTGYYETRFVKVIQVMP